MKAKIVRMKNHSIIHAQIMDFSVHIGVNLKILFIYINFINIEQCFCYDGFTGENCELTIKNSANVDDNVRNVRCTQDTDCNSNSTCVKGF